MAQEGLDEAGLTKYREVMGPGKDPTATPVIGIRAWTINHLFTHIWSGADLSTRERRLVTIALLAVQGHEDQLRDHIRGALQGGVGVESLRELMIHVAHYGGWAAGTRGHGVVEAVHAKLRIEGFEHD
jgi:4-carboxymuconolactone decarboxylase